MNMSNYIEPTGGGTEGDKAIQAYLREACEHKIALHVDAAIDVVDADPVEAEVRLGILNTTPPALNLSR